MSVKGVAPSNNKQQQSVSNPDYYKIHLIPAKCRGHTVLQLPYTGSVLSLTQQSNEAVETATKTSDTEATHYSKQTVKHTDEA